MYGNTEELAPDTAAAQDVRDAVAALNEAVKRAKCLGLQVFIDQNPRGYQHISATISKVL